MLIVVSRSGRYCEQDEKCGVKVQGSLTRLKISFAKVLYHPINMASPISIRKTDLSRRQEALKPAGNLT